MDQKAIVENEKGKYIQVEGEEIPVRTVPFGYVLPNLYLKNLIDKNHDQNRAVPRIFIVPKKEKIMFKFRFPHTSSYEYGSYFEADDTGENAAQVFTNDFIIYQEYIEGTGRRGDTSFTRLGHRDFNAVQIIRSSQNDKKYLIDTKEQKNFFLPFLSPYNDDYVYMPSEYDVTLKDKGAYDKWVEENQEGLYDAKFLHFDPRQMFVTVQVDLEK